jgi:hypothetical protein
MRQSDDRDAYDFADCAVCSSVTTITGKAAHDDERVDFPLSFPNFPALFAKSSIANPQWVSTHL